MDQQQVKLEKDEDKQEMERELKDLVSAAGKSRKKHKNQVLCLTYSWRWSIVFPNPSGLDLEASLYCANIFAKPGQIAEERPYQGFPYEYIVMFYICFKVISYKLYYHIWFSVVSSLPIQTYPCLPSRWPRSAHRNSWQSRWWAASRCERSWRGAELDGWFQQGKGCDTKVKCWFNYLSVSTSRFTNITSWTPKPSWTLQVEPPTHGDTGGNPDKESKLTDEITQLRAKVSALEHEAQDLRIERDNLSAEIANLKMDVGPEPPTTQQSDQSALTDEAARKRLWRLCKRGADGILIEWNK